MIACAFPGGRCDHIVDRASFNSVSLGKRRKAWLISWRAAGSSCLSNAAWISSLALAACGATAGAWGSCRATAATCDSCRAAPSIAAFPASAIFPAASAGGWVGGRSPSSSSLPLPSMFSGTDGLASSKSPP